MFGTSADSGDGLGQYLIKDQFRFVFISAFSQSQFAHQNLAGLGQHPLLSGGQATVFLTTPEITYDLGHFVHVTGGEFLAVGLVPSRPVGRLFGVRCTQYLEHPVKAFLANHITNTDDLCIVGWNADSQITLLNLQHQVDPLDALDNPGLDCLDLGRTMVRINNSLADIERHRGNPFRYYQGNTDARHAEIS
ncbi:MAG: hypothetical protein JWN95_2027 [Frankiales bacterium]|nr:hypothetical protein [Frankiales bacterium]